MRKRKISILALLLSIFFVFNAYAMIENKDPGKPMPATPSFDKDYVYGFRWTWFSDELCIQFDSSKKFDKTVIQKMYESGLVKHWYENGQIIKRDTYSGKWNQDINGIWSFKFDDMTIPVGVTKIDNVLYAFNGLGELKEGYNYYGDLRTAADGLVPTDNAELNKWLETEYLPECTSHE